MYFLSQSVCGLPISVNISLMTIVTNKHSTFTSKIPAGTINVEQTFIYPNLVFTKNIVFTYLRLLELKMCKPSVVKQRKNTAGVVLLDKCISLYLIYVLKIILKRSRKCILRVLMHFVQFTLSYSWIEFEQYCIEAKIFKKRYRFF